MDICSVYHVVLLFFKKEQLRENIRHFCSSFLSEDYTNIWQVYVWQCVGYCQDFMSFSSLFMFLEKGCVGSYTENRPKTAVTA